MRGSRASIVICSELVQLVNENAKGSFPRHSCRIEPNEVSELWHSLRNGVSQEHGPAMFPSSRGLGLSGLSNGHPTQVQILPGTYPGREEG
jgi:hypothetical protein